MRTVLQIDEIKGRISAPSVFENVITPLEISELVEFYSIAHQKIHKNTGPVTINFVPKTVDCPLFEQIVDRLRNLCHYNFRVYAAFCFEASYPHIIHNDDSFTFPNLYKAFTLPLWHDGDSNPSLCFFDQFYFNGPAKFSNKSENLPTYYNKQVYEYSDVVGKVDFPFDGPTELFTHLRPQWLEGLSFNSNIEWKPGNAIMFDSTRLHSASDFRHQNITRKIGISIFTEM